MEPLPPFLFAAKSQGERRWLARLKKEGRIRQIGPRVYTSLPDDQVDDASRRAWSTIVSALFPRALVSYRTALTYLPSPDGAVFLTSSTNRSVPYAGLRVEFVRGPDPLPDDVPFLRLRASSLPRALLENLSRDARTSTERTVPIDELERRLEDILRTGGEEELNRVRDRAREIAAAFGWHAEFGRLDAAIGALLGTRPVAGIASAPARARAAGEPFDPACLERLQILLAELRARAWPSVAEDLVSPEHARHKAFFEAYFSNFMEGTTFEIEEAAGIVFEQKIPAARPVDAHDILGTFQVVSDPNEMRRTPSSSRELLELLKTRHHTMLAERAQARPGRFKEQVNRAGGTTFVHPEYVVGTLKLGFELSLGLERGLARAVFMMFLTSDVHPFEDGNGRIARVMMNAEMTAAGAPTTIIPTVYRNDYLGAMRAMTRQHRPRPLIDALSAAAAFSRLDFSVYPHILNELERRNWFREPDEAKIIL
jgi:Fic/DOC family